MNRPEGISEEAWAEAVRIGWPIVWLNADAEQSAHNAIARALVAAERRGIERAADAYRDGAGPEDGKWDHFLSAELAIRLLGEAE